MPCLLHMLMPIAAKYSFTLALLTRAATGLACAPCFVSCYHFFPKWVPLEEKTLMVSTVGCGMYMVFILFYFINYLISLFISLFINFISNYYYYYRVKLLDLHFQVFLLVLVLIFVLMVFKLVVGHYHSIYLVLLVYFGHHSLLQLFIQVLMNIQQLLKKNLILFIEKV